MEYKDSEQTTIKIRKSTHEKIKAIRKEKGISISFLVDKAINDYLKNNERK